MFTGGPRFLPQVGFFCPMPVMRSKFTQKSFVQTLLLILIEILLTDLQTYHLQGDECLSNYAFIVCPLRCSQHSLCFSVPKGHSSIYTLCPTLPLHANISCVVLVASF
jgi:hypothetical protein